MDKVKGVLSVKEVADAAIGIYVTDCIRIAIENYGPEHSMIPGMKRIFLSALSGKNFAELTDEELEEFEQVLEYTRLEFMEGMENAQD